MANAGMPDERPLDDGRRPQELVAVARDQLQDG